VSTREKTLGAASKIAEQPDAPPLEAAALGDVVLNLVREVTVARIRHRALLLYLERKNILDYNEYEKVFFEIGERDMEAIFGSLMLLPEQFQEHFGEWLKSDNERYVKMLAGSKSSATKSKKTTSKQG
jgi:hypothetical protein